MQNEEVIEPSHNMWTPCCKEKDQLRRFYMYPNLKRITMKNSYPILQNNDILETL